MLQTHYLIAGASHAALAALHAIRLYDAERAATVVSRDDSLPYSPTVLPYVVSGRSQPERVFLRSEAYFEEQKIKYLRGAGVSSIAPERNVARLESGEEVAYAKLLVATGARPAIPPVEGLGDVRYHVLRSLDDALKLRRALPGARRAVVLGGGLIGMHAAENLAKAGVEVTVVEMRPQVLPGYFDAEASALIERAFARKGVRIYTGSMAVRAAPAASGCTLTVSGRGALAADLLLVAAGVVPATGFLDGTGIETDRGVLVDECMRTNCENIWAAGDVAQAKGFYGSEKVLNGILPEAVEQGRIAGMAMAGDPALKGYPGGVPINTYTFFGRQALSVGADMAPGNGVEVVKRDGDDRYLKIVLRDGRLQGIFGIDVPFDPGIMWQLILRRTDVSAVKGRFVENPRETARVLMSRTWR